MIKSGYDGLFLPEAQGSVCRLCVEGYGVSGALSKLNDASTNRPFDKTRDSFVLAEGACVVVMEDYRGYFKKRGLRFMARLSDTPIPRMHSIRQGQRTQKGGKAIGLAMEEAEFIAENVDYINAHGTSTPLGDKTETRR